MSESMRRFYFFLIFSMFLGLLFLNKFAQISPPHTHKLEMRQILAGQCIQDCMENPLLIDHIQATMVKPSGTSPVLENPDTNKQKGQEGQVDHILQHYNNKKNGFFIEAGAWDGEQLSNTLYLETQLGWTGLLVEPNKQVFDILVGKKRNAHSINSCLSIKGNAEKVKFDTADVYGAIDNNNDPKNDAKKNRKSQMRFYHKEVARQTLTVQCYPLYSILLALGNPKVDFMSLDIEGSELDVLRTLPFDKVDIEVFLIETNKANLTAVNDLMAKAGYEMTPIPPFDHLFVKK
eukprot:GFUD01090139.1.p1 GENE.GFUD01090139.1~~GFUD01090139.1.p1  ORF type:complete len:291 (-),score=83.39 GFUD01090139.1:16-888(-)